MAANVRQLRRDAVLEGVVDHLLEHGLGHASLRSLAAAVGTSDRTLTSRVLDLWFEWFEPHSSAPSAQRCDEIAAVIACACGLVMLRYLGRGKEAERAARALSGGRTAGPQRAMKSVPSRKARLRAPR